MNKINKKVILGIALSMIFSLAIMQGISQKNMQQQTNNIQQVGAGCIVLAAYSDNKAVSAVSGVYGGCVLEFAASSFGVWGAMGPVGWMIGGGLAL